MSQEAAEYLEAARCKVDIAAYHHARLSETLEDYPPDKTSLQAHFEGLFYAGVAAYEKLIPGLALAAGMDETARPAEVIRHLKEEEATRELGRAVEVWKDARGENGRGILDEANEIRNAATHRFYDKQQGAPGHWAYSVAESSRIRRRRDSMLAEFSEEWLGHVTELLPLIEAARELWQLPEVQIVDV